MTDIKDLERAWEDDPNNLKTYFALEGEYQKSGNWEGLIQLFSNGPETIKTTKDFGTRVIEVLNDVLEGTTAKADRAKILVALGDASLSHSSDRETAMRHYQTAHKEFPQDVTCLERARDMYMKTEDYDRVLLLYRLQGKVFSEPNEARFKTLLGLAQIHGEFKSNFKKAIPFIEEGLEISPDDSFAKELLSNYKSGKTIQSHVEQTLIEAKSAAKEKDFEVATLWFKNAAEIEIAREGGDLERAAEYAERAFGYDRNNRELEALVNSLLKKLGRSDEVSEMGGAGVAILMPVNLSAGNEEPEKEMRTEENIDGNRSTVKLDVSDLQRLKEADAKKRAESEEQSEAVEVAEEVEESEAIEVSDDVEESEAVEVAEEVEGAEAIEVAEEVEGSEAEVAQDVEESEAAEVEEKIEEEVETQPEVEANLESFEGCLAQLAKQPADLDAVDMLREYAAENENWGGYVQQLEHTLKRIRKNDRELEFMVSAGEICWKQLDDFERAEYHFKRVKLIDREQPQMLSFYEAFFEKNEEWTKLFPILNASISAASTPEERRIAEGRAADIAENKMDAPEKAIEIWRSALKENPSDEEAYEYISRLMRTHGKWSQLIEILKEKGKNSEKEEKIELLLLVAEIYEDKLEREASVASTLSEILTVDPERDDVFERLVALYEKQKNITHLVNITKERAEQKREKGDNESALDLKFKAAHLLSASLKNVSAAIPLYESILDIDQGNAKAVGKLEEIFEKRRDFDSLFNLKKNQIKSTDSDEERMAVLKNLVTLSLGKMKNREAAEPLLEEILKIEPLDLDALIQLEGIKRKNKDYKELATILVRKSAALDDDEFELKIAALGEAGDLFRTQHENLERACELWLEVLTLDENNSKAMAYLTDSYIRSANFDALDKLYRERNNLDRLYDLLDSAAGVSSEKGLQAVLFRRMATLAETELESTDRVIMSLESLRKISNRPEIIAEELIDWYAMTEDKKLEIEMHTMILDAIEISDKEVDSAKLFSHQSRLCELEKEQNNTSYALDWALKALLTQPSNEEMLDIAETLASKSKEEVKLIAGFDEAADLTEDPIAKENIWLRIAELHTQRGEVADAIDRYEAIRSNRPNDSTILKALENLYTESGEWERKVDILRSQIEASPDGEVVEDYRAQIAKLQLAQLGNTDDAKATFLEILENNPDHQGALRGLIEISKGQENWGDVIQYSLSELENATDDSRIRELQMSLGDVYRYEKEDALEAISYYALVLETHPGDVAAISCLEELLTSDAGRDAALILEPIFRDAKEYEKLASTLEARKEKDLDDEEALKILDELVGLYDGPLDNRTWAFERSIESLSLDPFSEARQDRIEDLGGILNRWEDVDAIFAEYAAKDAAAGPEESDLLRRLADIRETKLGNASSTIESLNLLVDIDPCDDNAYSGLERIYRTTSKHEALVDILIARSHLSDSDEKRVELLVDAATVCDDVLADTKKTISLYEQVLDIDGLHEQATDNLRELLRGDEDFEALASLLEKCALENEDPLRRRSMYLELANVNTYQLKDYDRSLEILRDLIASDTNDVDAIRELEFLSDAIGTDDPEKRLEIANLVEPAYRESDDHKKLIKVLESRVDLSDDVFAKVELLDELGKLYRERIGNSEAAFDSVSKAVVLSPDNVERRNLLETLGAQIGKMSDVIATLVDAVQDAQTHLRPVLNKRIAELQDEHESNPNQSIFFYEKALEDDDSDVSILLSLENLYRRTGKHEELAENLLSQSELSEPSRRVELFSQLGGLEDEILARPNRAIDAYQEWLNIEPEAEEALDKLEILFENNERWEDLAEVLSRKAGSDSTILTKLAVVREVQLDDQAGAIDVYNDILSNDLSNENALSELERLYTAAQQWPELSDVLRTQLVSGQEEDKTDIEMKLAKVLSERLFENNEAISLYQSILQKDANHSGAIDALELAAEDDGSLELVREDLLHYYSENALWEKKVGLLSRLESVEYDPERKIDYLLESGKIWQRQLEAPDAAIDAFSRAWAINNARNDAHEAIVSVASENGLWVRLSEIYEEAVLHLNDPDEIVSMRMRIGDLYSDQLDEPTVAEEQYEEALAVNPQYLQAYQILESMFGDQSRFADLVQLLQKKYEAFGINDPQMGMTTLHRIAQIQNDITDEKAEAVDTFERILAIEPRDKVAVGSIEELLSEQERWVDLNDHYSRTNDYADSDEERVLLKTKMAKVMASKLENLAGAIELYQDVLDIDAQNSDAENELHQMMERGEMAAEAALLLEPIYRQSGESEKLIRSLEAQIGDDVFENAQRYKEIARIQEQDLDDSDAAIQSLTKVFEFSPDDIDLRNELESLVQRTQSWEGLSFAFENALKNNFDMSDETRADILFEHAKVLEERLENFEQATEQFEAVLVISPTNEKTYDALDRLYSKTGNYEGLATLYERRVEISHGVEQNRWRIQLANLYEEILDEEERAIECYEAILTQFPTDLSASRSMERLLSKAKRWNDLGDLYRDQLANADTDESADEARYKLAKVLEGELDQFEEAMEIYREIVRRNSNHLGAKRALEGLLRDMSLRGDDARIERIAILDLLMEITDPKTEHLKVARWMEEKITLIDDVEEKVAIYYRIAEFSENSDRVDEKIQAMLALANAYQHDPTPIGLEARINKIAVETDTWDRLIPIYLSGLEKTEEPEFQEKLLVSIAGIYAGPMNDQDSAVSAYQEVLQLSPTNIHAVQHLEKLYTDLELWKPLVEILEAKVDNLFEVEEQERALKRIARIYDDVLDDIESAAHAYRRLLEINPGHRDYSGSLEKIYEETEQWVELDELLRAKVLQVDSDAEKAVIYTQIARIHRDMLMDDFAAVDAFRMVSECDVNDENAVNALVSLYERTEQWPDLLEALNTQKEFAEDVDSINDIELKIGRVLFEKLSSPFDALEVYKSVLSRDSQIGAARKGMVELLGMEDTRQDASQTLEKIYRENAEWSLIQEMYEKELSGLDDTLERGIILKKLAGLLESELENPAMSFITLGRGLRESPGDPEIWEGLDRLTVVLENPDECVAIFEDCVESPIDDPDLIRRLHTKLGKLYYQLHENGEASRHLVSALDIDAFDADALALLDEVYLREQDWKALSEILQRRISIVEGGEQNELRYRFGYIQEAVFDEREEAVEQYRLILLEDSTHEASIDGLERLSKDPVLVIEISEILEPVFIEKSQPSRLADLLISKQEGLEHPVDRAENYERIANLNLEVLENPHVGYAYLSRSFRIDPMNVDVQERIEELVEKMAMYEEQVALYEEVVQELDDTERANELSLVAAGLMRSKLEDDRGAWEVYHRVINEDGENEVALKGMEDIARQRGDKNALAMVLEQQSVAFYEPDLRRNAFLQLGAIKEEQEEFQAAIDAYQQAHLIDESDTGGLYSLVQLFEIVEDYDALVEYLSKLAEIQDDPSERYSTLKRCGQCAHVLLKDPRLAVDAYHKAVDIHPDSKEAHAALRELYAELEDWANCREMLRELATLSDSLSEQNHYRLEAAQLDGGVLSNPSSAIEEYRMVLKGEPRNELAFDSLVGLLKSEQRWEELHAFYQEAVEQTPPEEAQRVINLRVQLSEISARYLGDEAGAIQYLLSILEIDPTHPKALHVLADLYMQQGRFEEAVEILDRKLRDGRDIGEQVDAMMLRATLYERELGRPIDAANDYVRIIELQPSHKEAMASLKMIYTEGGAFPQVYDLIQFESAQCQDGEDKAALFMEMADIAKTHLGDDAKYIFALEKAYALTPNALPVVEQLVNSYINSGQTERAEPLVNGLIIQLKEQRRMKDVVRFLHLQGRLAEQKGDEDAAWTSFDAAHKVDASYLPNLLSLGKLLYRRQAWDEALKIFQTLQLQLMNIPDVETKVDVYHHLGMIRWYQSDHRRAKDMFRRAVGLNAQHQPSLEALQQLG